MVSLAAIETFASELWPKALSAAAREIDPRRASGSFSSRSKKMRHAANFRISPNRRASDLMVPAEVMIVEALPLLGSGKLDLPAIDAMVRDRGR